MSASNVAQSVRDRLLNRARRGGEDFQALCSRAMPWSGSCTA